MNIPPTRIPDRFAMAFDIFLVLILVGTAGYRWLEGMSTIDALYMTVITISTVGFGEVRALSPTGRIFTIGLILGGGGLAAFAITTTVDFLTSGEWRIYLDSRRHSRMLSELTNHVIIGGFGRVGRHVAEELAAEKVPFIVIDVDEDRRPEDGRRLVNHEAASARAGRDR